MELTKEYPTILWLCLLNSFVGRIFRTFHAAIIEEADLGIKYADLQEHTIIDSDDYLTDFGWNVYCAIKRFALSEDVILHLIHNSHAIESLSDPQLNRYLQDQFDLF